MSGSKILVADDEPAIRRLLAAGLSRAGHRVIEAASAREALAAVQIDKPDAVLLDLGLPDRDGLELVSLIKSSGSAVLVISARDATDQKVAALDLGADDYVTKPFGTDELLARLRAALRHRLQQQGERPIFRNADLSVDLVRRLVTVRGDEVKLSPREYDLLRLLVAHAGKVLTHRFILREIWGGDTDVQYLRIYVRSLRQKIEADPERPQHLITETGVGYRLRGGD